MITARPNVLIVMYDQLTPAMLGCYGGPARSPAIDRLSSEGVTFDAAYTNSPLCTPGRYCMMTGRLPSSTGGFDNASYLPSTIPTLAHVARRAGYRTMLAGKMHFVGPDQLHGFESRSTTDIYPADFGWTPDWRTPDRRIDWWYHNLDSVTGAGTAEVTNQLLFDDEVGHNAMRALHDLARSDDDRPFLLVASFTHPHDPYVTRQQYWDRYDHVDIPMPVVSAADVQPDDAHSARLRAAIGVGDSYVADEHVRSARRAYLGNISYVDDWTDRLVGALQRLGLNDDTVVMLVADHGDMLGERGLWYKMNFFEGAARIPLVIHAPARFGPRRVDAPVSLVDVLPTIAQLVDADVGELIDPIAGRSLIGLCEGEPDENPGGGQVIGEYMAEGAVAPIVMVRRGQWKFVHCAVDHDQLYDVAHDSHELTNLASSPEHADLVAVFRQQVADRWDLEALRDEVLRSQGRRRYATEALRQGEYTPWDYTPPADASRQYMRNHLDLNDVERNARWPR
jgi:choline-sulfatase